MKFLTLIVLALLFCVPIGCATPSSIGDQMVDRGKAAKQIGKQWNKGDRMVKKGERMLSASERLSRQSEKNAKKSEQLMSDGEQLLTQGRKLMQENEATYNEKFPETE